MNDLNGNEHKLIARLEKERRKNGKFRILIEKDHMQNGQLQAKIQCLRQQFESNMREIYQACERSFTWYLIEVHMLTDGNAELHKQPVKNFGTCI